MEYVKLPKEFYLADTLTVARRLLGFYLVCRSPQGVTACRITETEAYCGPEDKACHAYKRKAPNGRTNVMYQEGGCAYVYLIYGMYNCFNVVTRPAGQPEAVLVRAGEPMEGLELMRQRRKSPKGRIPKDKDLLSGPGKLCRAMDITRELYGQPLWGDVLFLAQGKPVGEEQVAVTPRINIDYAGEDAKLPYRFVMK